MTSAASIGEPVGYHHLARLQTLLQGVTSPFSEYSLANLYCYRQVHNYRLVEGDLPFVIGTTYDGVTHALPLIKISTDSAERMLAVAQCIYPLTEFEATSLAGEGFRLSNCDADSDYIFNANQLSALVGARKKLSQARRFARQFNPVIEPLGQHNFAGAIEVLDGWQSDVGKPESETDYSNCKEALANLSELDLEGWLVKSDNGENVGLLLSGTGSNGSRIFHFAKGRRHCLGVYPWMFSACAARFQNVDINFEQDLGNPRFAQSKRAFTPRETLTKYRIERS